MLSDIVSGNAKEDGSEFRFWLVGSVEQWCRSRGIPFTSEKYGIRDQETIEVKWGMYKRGDERSQWAGCSDRTAMSVLIRGDFTFTFREADRSEEVRSVRLRDEGDYVVWREDVEHTWRMNEDSEILTMRWK